VTKRFQGGLQLRCSSSAKDLEPEVLRTIWDTIPRPLMTVGKKGVEETHCNSMRELLSAHSVVKVKFVDRACGEGESGAALLGAMSGALLLQQKGSTFLFCRSGIEPEELLQVAGSNLSRREARASHRGRERAQRQSAPPELPPILCNAVLALMRAGKLRDGELDRKALWALADLPTDAARAKAAKLMAPEAAVKIENMSAWVTSICRRAAREESA